MITECKCSTTVEALLNPETDEVICQNPKCGRVIENISPFMKASMRQQGQIVRHDGNVKIPAGGMLVECNNETADHRICGAKFVALLEKKDDECYCPKCKNKYNLNAFSKALLRENGQYVGMIKESEPDMDIDLEGESGKVVTINANGAVPTVSQNGENQ